jgi:hypothetical protein
MIHTRRTSILTLAFLACAGCGRTQAPLPAGPAHSVSATFAGQIVLAGELAHARTGRVRVQAWRAGEAGRAGTQPFFSRSYVIGDPDWSIVEGELTRYFGLCDADRVGEDARELPEEFEIEASFEPEDATVAAKPAWRGSARARNGAQQVLITVAPKLEMAQPPGGRKQGG